MAITGITPFESFNYKLSSDPGEGDEATYFKLGTLDKRVMAWIQDRHSSYTITEDGRVDQRINTRSTLIDYMCAGVRGWTNFKDSKGNDIEYKTVTKSVNGKRYEFLDDKVLLHFQEEWIVELADQINKINTLGVTETKN